MTATLKIPATKIQFTACPKCKKFIGDGYLPGQCECGERLFTFTTMARKSARKCSGSCLHATGSECKCECEGSNHGKGWFLQ